MELAKCQKGENKMAVLNKISVSNFRNVKHCDFCFAESNNLVIEGKNAIGKTNTLNAIHWAFTGVNLDGSNDNRSNLAKGTEEPIVVTLEFDGFSFTRKCEMVDGSPTVTILINDIEQKSIKAGEAMLHTKLGLSDIVLAQPSGFDIVRFLLNPFYFDGVSAKSLRNFMIWLAHLDLISASKSQGKKTLDIIKEYKTNDPTEIIDALGKEKRTLKKNIDCCKTAKTLFKDYPDFVEIANKTLAQLNKDLVVLETKEALIEKYALFISNHLNTYYQSALGIKICMLEKGVGEDVYKDVCYPILPKSNLPFSLGSQAERTIVAIKFIQSVCLGYNIKPLPLLIDNMESLDSDTLEFLEELNVQYIGARVKEV